MLDDGNIKCWIEKGVPPKRDEKIYIPSTTDLSLKRKAMQPTKNQYYNQDKIIDIAQIKDEINETWTKSNKNQIDLDSTTNYGINNTSKDNDSKLDISLMSKDQKYPDRKNKIACDITELQTATKLNISNVPKENEF